MSSPMNNILQAQSLPPAPSSSSSLAETRPRGAHTPANATNIIKQQQLRSSSNEQSSTSAYLGRSGRRGSGGGRGRGGYRVHSDRPDSKSHHHHHVTPSTVENINRDASSQAPSNATPSSDQTVLIAGGVVGQKIQRKSVNSKAGGGKYRQRQQTNQLIEGMEGLNIDLIESLAPTNSGAAATVASRRERHPTNSRKVNLTHLLNYSYDRKQRHGGRQRNSSYSDDNNAGSNQRQNYSYYRDSNTVHKFSKQQFLQANCQFVVLNGYDYTIHKVDPDWPIDWDCIEEVKFRQSASTETTCPICLDPPVAAKITRCGHIYCWTCMLHYLSLSDENCRQCPICFEPVYRSDLRSVVSQLFSNHATEEEIVMKLMIRRKGCVDVEPFGKEYVQSSDPSTLSLSYFDQEHYSSQANLVIVDPKTVISEVTQREKDELSIKYDLDRNELEVCFIEQALDWLSKRVDKLQKSVMDPTKRKNQPNPNRTEQALRHQCNPESKSYLFYQSADGQHIYLNPFSTKILCNQYNSLENCPLEIRAKILQMDWVSMSEAWRKRFKYLEHLPLTCEFRLIEIDFEKSDLVSADTFDAFKDQIKLRADERERRRRVERKREKIIQVEQNRKIYGIQPSLKINLNNIEQFPSVSDERYLGLTKIRNQSSDNDLSSDDETIGEHLELANQNANAQAIESNEQRSASIDASLQVEGEFQDTSESNAGIALSFLEIQQQEAALAAKTVSTIAAGSATSGAWGGKKSSGGGGGGGQTSGTQSSSFAQLLAGAKTNQRDWTRNTNQQHHPTTPSSGFHPKTGQPMVPSAEFGVSRYSQAPTDLLDESQEAELRAPPSEFTISDFIDMNVVSGRRGKGRLNKNVGKKS